MSKLTSDMINATIREIEEPLITEKELSKIFHVSRQAVGRTARGLGINPYSIMMGRHYHNAYDKEMVKKIIAERSEKVKYFRKNILDVNELT